MNPISKELKRIIIAKLSFAIRDSYEAAEITHPPPPPPPPPPLSEELSAVEITSISHIASAFAK
jgi:hypothetical protein